MKHASFLCRPATLALALVLFPLPGPTGAQPPVPGADQPAIVPVPRDNAYPPFPGEASLLDLVFSRYPTADRDAVTAFIQKQLPEEYEEYMLLAFRDRNRAARHLVGLVQEALYLMASRDRDAERYDLLIRQRSAERDAFKLADMIRGGAGAVREEKLKALRSVLQEAFELKQELMKRDIRKLEDDMSRLRQWVDERKKNEAAIIENRVQELTGQGARLGW